MARAVKKPLGGVRGRVGDVVYRYMNGRTFISVYNGDVKISQSKKSINNRSKFGTAVKFAKAVNSVSDLNKVWDFSSEQGRSPYTKIFKHNYKSIKADFISEYCKITPNGVGLFVDSCNLNPDNITVKIKIDRASEQRLLPPYKVHFVVYLNQSVNPEIRENIAFAFSSAFVPDESPAEFQTVTAEFIDYNKRFLTYYKNATVFFAVVKTESKPLEWSETESKIFIIN